MLKFDGNLFLHLSASFYILGFISILLGIIGQQCVKRKNPPLMQFIADHNSRIVAYGRCLNFCACSSLIISLLALAKAYAASDLSVMNVVMNSSNIMPLYYRVAAMWGNHEGSMLLLTTYFAIAGAIFTLMSRDNVVTKYAIVIQVSIQIVLLLFIIFTSNPFVKIFPSPRMGLGLNAILQDYALIIHPPVLYWGYAGCVIIYSIGIAVIQSKRVANKNWISLIKPWIMFSWGFLTFGIGLGSWWAYKEIGWGGFWFWDPVENISILPWFLIAALSHSVVRQLKGRKMALCFAIGSFLSVLISICLVRAGVLKSVHSFASSPERGIFLLSIFIIYTIYGLWQMLKLLSYADVLQTSKEQIEGKKEKNGNIIVMGNYSLTAAFLATAFGVFCPLLVEIFAEKSIAIEANYFNWTVNGTILITLLFCSIVTYRILSGKSFPSRRYIRVFCTVTITIVICYYFAGHKSIKLLQNFITLHAIDGLDLLAICGIGLSIFMIIIILPKLSVRGRLNMRIGHLCFSIGVLAISVCSYAGMDEPFVMKIDEKVKFLDYNIHLKDVKHAYRSNYLTKTAVLEISHGNMKRIVEPEMKMYPLEKQVVLEPAILRYPLYDLNINFSRAGEINHNEFLISIFYRPMLSWLWAAILLMFIAMMIETIRLFLAMYKNMHR